MLYLKLCRPVRRRAQLKTGHRLKVVCAHNNSLVHALKPHKSSTSSIILELNYKDRTASLLYYLYYIEYLNAFL